MVCGERHAGPDNQQSTGLGIMDKSLKLLLLIFFSCLLGVGGLFLFLVFVGIDAGASFWIILFGFAGFLYVLKKMIDKRVFKKKSA